MAAPLVSVLIPTYNGEDFIAETIASVLSQTWSDFELIVGDDGSTDRTVEIVRAATLGDPRAQVLVYDRNIGSFNSVNRLFALARGRYVKYLLQDDLLDPAAIETFVAALEAEPRIMLATSRRRLIDEHGARLPDGPHSAPITDTSGVIDGRELGDFVLTNMLNVIGELSTSLFRRDIELGDPPLSIDTREMVANGDIALWLKLLARGDAYYTPEELSSFRQHPQQSSRLDDVHAGGLAEWPVMVDRARALGFLADPARERQAHVRIARSAVDLLARFAGTDLEERILEVLYLTTARLAEMRDGAPAPAGDLARFHAEPFRSRLSRPLDAGLPVLRHRPPVAEAAVAEPAADPAAVAAAVEALRTLFREGAARRYIALVPPEHLESAEPLYAEALAAGDDFDLELVPAADVEDIRQPGWILVRAA
jgi:glycosyltransferase involved in cell wall biosynthesis